MPFLTDAQREAQAAAAVALARRPPATAAQIAASWDRIEATLARAARVAAVRYLKDMARRYVRDRDLSDATGVYREFCRDMACDEAIRRLTEALRAKQSAYAASPVGSLNKDRSSVVEVISIKAALLCERLARRRDRAQAAELMRSARAA